MDEKRKILVVYIVSFVVGTVLMYFSYLYGRPWNYRHATLIGVLILLWSFEDPRGLIIAGLYAGAISAPWWYIGGFFAAATFCFIRYVLGIKEFEPLVYLEINGNKKEY